MVAARRSLLRSCRCSKAPRRPACWPCWRPSAGPGTGSSRRIHTVSSGSRTPARDGRAKCPYSMCQQPTMQGFAPASAACQASVPTALPIRQ
eukprot:365716-Chlamydomonas_euryale.AAC.3